MNYTLESNNTNTHSSVDIYDENYTLENPRDKYDLLESNISIDTLSSSPQNIRKREKLHININNDIEYGNNSENTCHRKKKCNVDLISNMSVLIIISFFIVGFVLFVYKLKYSINNFSNKVENNKQIFRGKYEVFNKNENNILIDELREGMINLNKEDIHEYILQKNIEEKDNENIQENVKEFLFYDELFKTYYNVSDFDFDIDKYNYYKNRDYCLRLNLMNEF